MQRSTVESGNLNCVMKYTEEEGEERNIKRWLYIHKWPTAVSKPMVQFDDENVALRGRFKMAKPLRLCIVYSLYKHLHVLHLSFVH